MRYYGDRQGRLVTWEPRNAGVARTGYSSAHWSMLQAMMIRMFNVNRVVIRCDCKPILDCPLLFSAVAPACYG